jgi:hypothetical protein
MGYFGITKGCDLTDAPSDLTDGCFDLTDFFENMDFRGWKWDFGSRESGVRSLGLRVTS